jgi:hypothetical protein
VKTGMDMSGATCGPENEPPVPLDGPPPEEPAAGSGMSFFPMVPPPPPVLAEQAPSKKKQRPVAYTLDEVLIIQPPAFEVRRLTCVRRKLGYQAGLDR